MKLRFNKNYFIVSLLLVLSEIAIVAGFNKGFIRHTFGDFLVVILLYYFFKSFLKARAFQIAITSLCIAYVIEFLQATDFLKYLGLEQNKWAALVFGNSFSIQDLLAYTLGIAFVLFMERSTFFKKWFN